MKNKHFFLIFISIILVLILTFTLQCLFSEKTRNFGFSCGAYFLSIFALFCYKNALKPSDPFVIDHTKRHYERKGELPKYKELCKIIFIVLIGFGVLFLLGGIKDIAFEYVKALFVKPV